VQASLLLAIRKAKRLIGLPRKDFAKRGEAPAEKRNQKATCVADWSGCGQGMMTVSTSETSVSAF
jgi:hypothetical protein